MRLLRAWVTFRDELVLVDWEPLGPPARHSTLW